MSNQDPWGGTSSDAGGGSAYWNTQSSQNPYDPLNNGVPPGDGQDYTNATGLAHSKKSGHSWNITDLWGGDNPYADWSLDPSSFAPQGASASFYDSLAKQYAGQNQAQIGNAVQGANQAWNQYQGNMGNVNSSLGMLQSAAAGNAPSAAQIQMNQGIQQSIAAQQALANSSRGGPGAWAAGQNNAARQMASTQQSAIQQGAALRAQEMAQARGQYAQMAQGAGAMDLQAQNQMGQYQLGMQKQDQATMLGLLGYGQQAGQIANAQENAWNNIVSGAAQNNAGNASSAMGSTAAAAGTMLAAMSDVNAKTNVQSAGSPQPSTDQNSLNAAALSLSGGSGGYTPGLAQSMARAMMSDVRRKTISRAEGYRGPYEPRTASEEMLDNLHPYSFNYKPGIGENPYQRHYGVMAQDLERSRMGQTIVKNTPIGKQIDVTHAMGTALAALADLNARMHRLEGKR